MHFHLPKPLHGWRELAGEVGIIVLGVLIALGFEQLVEGWHWQEQVRAGRAALKTDFMNIVANAEEQEAEDKCIRARLLFLRNLLDAHPDALQALGHIGSPASRTWYPTTWTSLVASNVSTHMPRTEMLYYAGIADQAYLAEQETQRELDDWAVLFTMVGPARKLAPGEAAQLRKALSDAAYHLNEIYLIAPQIKQSILNSGLLTRSDLKQAHQAWAVHLNGPNYQHICGPIDAPDHGRVDAPYDPAVQPNPLRFSNSDDLVRK
jgi:hypothetical protein